RRLSSKSDNAASNSQADVRSSLSRLVPLSGCDRHRTAEWLSQFTKEGLPHPGAGFLVHLTKSHFLGPGCAVQLHRNRHQPKAQMPFPHRRCHMTISCVCIKFPKSVYSLAWSSGSCGPSAYTRSPFRRSEETRNPICFESLPLR